MNIYKEHLIAMYIFQKLLLKHIRDKEVEQVPPQKEIERMIKSVSSKKVIEIL